MAKQDFKPAIGSLEDAGVSCSGPESDRGNDIHRKRVVQRVELLGGHGLRADGQFIRRQRRQRELFGDPVEHKFQSAHGAPINDPRPWHGVNRRVADGGGARRAFPRHIRFSGATASLLGGPAAGAEDCEHAHCALVRLLKRPCRFGEQGFAAGDDLNYVAVTADHKNAFERLETPERLQNFRDHDSKSG